MIPSCYVKIAIEHGHRNREFSHCKWWCSIVHGVYKATYNWRDITLYEQWIYQCHVYQYDPTCITVLHQLKLHHADEKRSVLIWLQQIPPFHGLISGEKVKQRKPWISLRNKRGLQASWCSYQFIELARSYRYDISLIVRFSQNVDTLWKTHTAIENYWTWP